MNTLRCMVAAEAVGIFFTKIINLSVVGYALAFGAGSFVSLCNELTQGEYTRKDILKDMAGTAIGIGIAVLCNAI